MTPRHISGPLSDDGALIQRYLAGDMEAINALISAHSRAIMQTTFALLGNREDAQDALQETWVRALRNLRAFRVGAEFRPWVLAIAAHEALSVRRTIARGVRRVLRQQQLSAEDVAYRTDVDSRLDVLDALRHLPHAQRTAVILRYYHDLTVAQIAVAMDKPEGTVKYWLSVGLRRLRGELDKGNTSTG